MVIRDDNYQIFDNEGKEDKRSVGYRAAPKDGKEQCSLCVNWLGKVETQTHSSSTGACYLVAGVIRTYDICDLYEKGPAYYEHYYGRSGAAEWCEECQSWEDPGHSSQHDWD